MLSLPSWMQRFTTRQSFGFRVKPQKQNDGIYALPQGVFSETWDYNEGEKPRPELFRLNKLKRTIVVGEDEKVMKNLTNWPLNTKTPPNCLRLYGRRRC